MESGCKKKKAIVSAMDVERTRGGHDEEVSPIEEVRLMVPTTEILQWETSLSGMVWMRAKRKGSWSWAAVEWFCSSWA